MKRATYIEIIILCLIRISIHALVKRATSKTLRQPKGQKISIHALVKRATASGVSVDAWKLYFNPRPREEGDPLKSSDVINENDFNPRPREEGDSAKLNEVIDSTNISIHALVKRATIG